MNGPEADRLLADWSARWPDALALWSRFTKLTSPRWCLTAAEEKEQKLSGSFAMIRLEDQAVVISLAQVASFGLQDHPLEIMGHEIGHHVYCPADLADQGRMIARMRRSLPTKEHLAPLLANIYADLLINDRLQRRRGLDMAGVYAKLGGGSTDPLWSLYMRICEILWGLERGRLAAKDLPEALEGDARLGASLARTYTEDWLPGAGRFAALCFPYLVKDEGKELRRLLAPMLDSADAGEGGDPGGLAEIEDGEEEDAVHPAEEGDGAKSGDGAAAGRVKRGGVKSARRYRGPVEYRELLRALGVAASDADLTAKYYRERALPLLIPFPTRESPRSAEPLPEGLETWDFADGLEKADWVESVIASPRVVPGVTTLQRREGLDSGAEPEKVPLDLYVGVDCSGSMRNPALDFSYPVLAGTVLALSALRAGARVMVCLSGEPGSTIETDGFLRDERAILRVLTDYLGTGTTFGVHRLLETFARRPAGARRTHILIVTDGDIFSLLDAFADFGGRRFLGWEAARLSVANAGGGGTYVLHESRRGIPDASRMRDDGWNVHLVASQEELVDFARAFSRENYAPGDKNG